ncbi:MAG: sulfite exporter TauE/SafE family protein, partial [Aequorivita sp.]|nr:sulfite exporter TauE/SafE family protein [Aequorivita sp.]
MLYTALIFGLLGSFHCVGMCGPIAFLLPVDRSNNV